MKVLLVLRHPFELWNAPAWLPERLRADFPQHTFHSRSDYDGVEADLRDAEVAITWSLRPEQLAAAPRLRWIHSPAAAVHQLLYPQMVASDVVITNASGVHGPVVAEHALAVMLALAKRLPSAVRHQQRRSWAQSDLWREQPRPRELDGGTLLLVGLGNIGREVVKRALAFGLRVLAVREHPQRGPEGAHAVHGFADLDRLLPEADFILLAAPLTPRTAGLISAQRLALMKPDAYLINVSRGPLIDEAALLAALRSRAIGGAALDVFSQEPLPADSPFWELDNLLITPHTAAVTEKLWERHYAVIRENLTRYLRREPLLHVVDKSRGY